jgi:autotransporter-associated beta strand protein
VELYGQLNSNDTSNVLMKWGDGTLTLGGPGDNISMSLDAKQGTVNLNKMSVSGTHAVFGINSVDSGAKVKYTGTGDYQVYGGGPITLTGGAIDFNGHNQASTGTVTVSTADSTLANTASGTTSTFSPAQIKMNQNMTVNAVGDLTIAGQISYTGSNNSSRTLTKTGTGLLTLTNSSSRSNYRGGTVINEGNLLYATTASHPTTGATTINSGGALVAGGAYTTVSDWLNSSRGTINTSSTGSLALAANNSEAINLASYPSLSIGAAAGSYTYSGTLTPANSIYRFGGGGGTLTVSSALTGASRQLQVNGKGAVVLSGANTYQGGTTIDRGGILKFNSGALPSTGQVTINGDGTLVGEGAYSTVQSWLSSGRIATSSAGTLALTGTNTVALNMGNYNNLWLGAYGNATYSGTLTHGNNNGNSYLLGGGNGTLTIGSALHDATGQHSMVVVKNNVVFTNSGNDYTERTMIYGTLMLKSSASINSSNKIQLWNNGSLFADSTTPVTCPIEFDTAGTVGGTGTYNTNLNVANGGHLSPGASGKGSIGGMLVNGNIAMDASSVLDIDLTSPSNTDYLWLGYHTTQSVILDGIINLTYNGTDGAPAGGEYHIIRGLYLPNLTNNGLELGDVPIGHFWDLELQPTASGYYDLVAITAPEPGTWMISATGLAGLLAYRWRKRR